MTTVAIVVATVLSYFVGWALKLPLLVPVLNTLASFPFMRCHSAFSLASCRRPAGVMV